MEMVAAHHLGGLLKMECGLPIAVEFWHSQLSSLALALSKPVWPSPLPYRTKHLFDLASVLLFCLCQNSTQPPTTTFHAPDDHQDGMQPP